MGIRSRKVSVPIRKIRRFGMFGEWRYLAVRGINLYDSKLMSIALYGMIRDRE